MIIRNAKVFTQEGIFEDGDIYIRDGIIAGIRTCEKDDEPNDNSEWGEEIDASGLLAIPGLVDIHFHGAVGCDFCDADEDGLKAILDYELSYGVMSVCPATMTFPEETLMRVIDTALSVREYSGGADLVGINMEGPFINPDKVAAQNPEYVAKGDSAMLRRLLSRGQGLIKLVDIAPEIDKNMELIDEFKGEVRFSLAHTLSDYNTAKEAYRRGASQLTHTFNAMKDIAHREPGPVLAALESGVYVELIADGIHNHDAVIRMTFRLFDEDKVVLISDSMMATGFEDGSYMLGGQSVSVKGHECRLTEHPETIAGSNTNLFECLKHAVKDAKVSFEKAILAASGNPARAMGIDDKYGSIRKGCQGNIILMNEDFEIKYLVKDGIIV